MLLGVPREIRLTSAKNTFLLDCKAAELSAKTMRAYGDILTGFIRFAGDMLVRELGPDHVRFYIADLSDRSPKTLLMRHYAVIRMWVRWIYAQKTITERGAEPIKAPRYNEELLFSKKNFAKAFLTSESCAGSRHKGVGLGLFTS